MLILNTQGHNHQNILRHHHPKHTDNNQTTPLKMNGTGKIHTIWQPVLLPGIIGMDLGVMQIIYRQDPTQPLKDKHHTQIKQIDIHRHMGLLEAETLIKEVVEIVQAP
jgi:hypothetical protein